MLDAVGDLPALGAHSPAWGSAASVQRLQRRRQAQRRVTCSRLHSRFLAKLGPSCSLAPEPNFLTAVPVRMASPRSHWGDLRVPRALRSLCAQVSIPQPHSGAPRRQGSRHHSTELGERRGPEGYVACPRSHSWKVGFAVLLGSLAEELLTGQVEALCGGDVRGGPEPELAVEAAPDVPCLLGPSLSHSGPVSTGGG